jgi:hypothetical protein
VPLVRPVRQRHERFADPLDAGDGQRIERVIGHGQISTPIGATDPYRGKVVPDTAPGCYWPIEDADQ